MKTDRNLFTRLGHASIVIDADSNNLIMLSVAEDNHLLPTRDPEYQRTDQWDQIKRKLNEALALSYTRFLLSMFVCFFSIWPLYVCLLCFLHVSSFPLGCSHLVVCISARLVYEVTYNVLMEVLFTQSLTQSSPMMILNGHSDV